MKVILPFELSPIIRTYLNHAYPFGIVEGHFGKNFVSELMCDIYVNCLYSQEDRNNFYQYPEDGWFEKCGLMRQEPYVCREKTMECVQEAIEEVRRRLSNGQYVYASPNEGYISVVSRGRIYDFDHECLLYGFDDAAGVYMSAGYINGRYVPYAIPYGEYEAALLNVQKSDIELLFFRVNRKYIFPGINAKNVADRLSEYYDSYIPGFLSRRELSQYISSGRLKFGRNAWREFALYLRDIGNECKQVDMRYTRSFMDHKQLMKIRIETLYEKGFISDDALVLAASECYSKAQLAMSLAMKYAAVGDSNALRRAAQKITDVNEREEVYLKQVISELRESSARQ